MEIYCLWSFKGGRGMGVVDGVGLWLSSWFYDLSIQRPF